MVTEIVFIDIINPSRRFSFVVDHLGPLFIDAPYEYGILAGSHNFGEDADYELLSRAKNKDYLFPHKLHCNGITIAEFLV